nr:alkane 1-monooxygenase [Mycolicibacterium sp. CBMA 234]
MSTESTSTQPRTGAASPSWTDPKRYLWLLAASIPGMVPLAWMLVAVSGSGVWWWIGPVLTFAVMPALDHLVGTDERNPPDAAYVDLDRDRWYRWATYAYLPGQYLSLVFSCWLLSGGGWVQMSWADKAGLMTTIGIVGAIAINAAHELGHKRSRLEKRLAKIALAQTTYGHFYVEHNHGHHLRVATPQDPATARLGQSLYQFIPWSVLGGVRSAWQFEVLRLKRLGRPIWLADNNILNAWALSIVLYAVLIVWFGATVLPWLCGQAAIGGCLLETINYIEHYGLSRQRRADGGYEPVAPRHSWNSNTLVANVFLFHLQRHSDHHANPQRRYQTLRTTDAAPELPGGYGTMLVIALIPPLWHRIMDPRVIAHHGGRIESVAQKRTTAPSRTRYCASRRFSHCPFRLAKVGRPT